MSSEVTWDKIKEAYDLMAKHKATYIVPTELATQAQEIVDQHMLGGLVTVVPSEAVPKDRIYVIDEAKLQECFMDIPVPEYHFDYNEAMATAKDSFKDLDIG